MLDVVGGALHRLVAVAPTTVRPGEPFDALVKAEDVWGNPCERFDGEVRARRRRGGARRPARAASRWTSGELAVARLTGLRLARRRRRDPHPAPAAAATRVESNLIRAVTPGEPKTFWGDLHGQTRATVGTGTIEEYFAFGRDIALLDMMCHQANDFQVTEAEWQRLRREIERFHADGRCVIFVGYEWSGMTPGGGDRNVMFRGDVASLHRSSHAEVDDMTDAATDCFPVTDLFKQFARARRRHADPAHRRPLRRHRRLSRSRARAAWSRSTPTGAASSGCCEDALRAGYKVGVVANSDGHKGRPGASHPGASTFGAYGGLTCVLAESLTREAVFDAIRARRCYGVTGGAAHPRRARRQRPADGRRGPRRWPGARSWAASSAPARSSGSTSSGASS